VCNGAVSEELKMVALSIGQDWAMPEEQEAAREYAMVISWYAGDGVFLASFPDAPGVITHGDSREQAAAQGEEAILGWLVALRDAGRPVPPPKSHSIDEILSGWL
jgi:predicted RNase H-like HicB family nuclease